MNGLRRGTARRARTGWILILVMIMGLNAHANSDDMIKKPNVAGQFYDSNPAKISQEIDRFLKSAEITPSKNPVKIIIVPHAGHVYSGPVAAHAFKAASAQQYKTIIVLAPTHHYDFKGVSIWPKGGFQTPLGIVKIDETLSQKLIDSDENIGFEAQVFEREHSLEVELPFIQNVFPNAQIVAAINGRELDLDFLKRFVGTLNKIMKDRDDVLLVISTDMSHFHDDKTARALDKAGYEAIADLDADEILKNNNKTMEIDGVFPVLTAIGLAKTLNLEPKVLNYANSGDITGDLSSVVGYVAMSFVGATGRSPVQDGDALTLDQKKTLIHIARTTVDEYVRTSKAPEFKIDDPRLLKEEGAFVTLHKKGNLRGCIGNIIGRGPLAKTVRDMAVAAASEDPRFDSVSSDELADIDIEVSVLSVPKVTKNVDEIVMGVHGVIISRGERPVARTGFGSPAARGGVFLPQVATETGWSKEEFLSQLCSQKAGLPRDCWKEKETKIEIFTAQVFGESSM